MKINSNAIIDFQNQFDKLSKRAQHFLMDIKAIDINGFKDNVIDKFHLDLFSNMRNCGNLTNLELLKFKTNIDKILLKYPKISADKEPLSFMKIQKIEFQNEFEKLSRRSKHLLMRINSADLNGFRDNVIDKFHINFFKNMRNCGELSHEELLKFKENIETRIINDPKEEIEKIPIKLNYKHKIEFQNEFEKLSRRSKHLLLRIKAADIKSFRDNVIDKFHGNFFLQLKNCGVGSNEELLIFKIKIDEIIVQHSSFISKGLFMEINSYLENEYLNLIEKDLFENHYKFIDSNNLFLTLDEIATKHGLTRERIRQYKKPFLEKLKKLIIELGSSIKLFETGFSHENENFKTKSSSNLFMTNFSDEVFYVEEKDAQFIRDNQDVNFSKNFIVYILSCLAMPTYYFRQINVKATNFNGLFIKQIVGFDFKRLFNDISSLKESRRESDINFKLKNFIPGYFNSNNQYKPELHKTTIVQAIRMYINLTNDVRNNITIDETELKYKRTTKKKVYEYLIDILEDYDRPLHFTEIYDECKLRGIKTKTATAVHSSMQLQPEIFGLKGQGIYGLKKWGGYFGNIGDVAEQCLRENKGPISWIKLKDFLSRELIISQDSVNTVLFFYENENRFILKGEKVYLKKWLKN